MHFEFTTATRIIFGPGTFKDIGSIAGTFGKQALVVASSGGADSTALVNQLKEKNLDCSIFLIQGEPKIDQVVEGVSLAQKNNCDLIIGFGGGSAIDMAKAIGVMLANPGEPLDYMEVIGKGKPINFPGVPVIAIPTTSGTGAEVTRNAVLASPEQRAKASMRSPYLLPRLALVDPELTFSLPAPVTASTGMDALTQVIEPYVSLRANPLTDALCGEGIKRGAAALMNAYKHGNDPAAREGMALVSLFGGLALANAGLGAVHGFAAPFGGIFNAPHGAVCARFLAPVVEVNIRAIRERQPDNPVLGRFAEIAQWLTAHSRSTLEDGVKWLYGISQQLQIPGLASYGLTTEGIPSLVEMGVISSSMKANPIQLTRDELREIIEKAL